MNHACAYCGYSTVRVVRDYTGAPYATCPRCYRANLLYRVNSLHPSIEKNAVPTQTTLRDTGPNSLLEPPPPK